MLQSPDFQGRRNRTVLMHLELLLHLPVKFDKVARAEEKQRKKGEGGQGESNSDDSNNRQMWVFVRQWKWTESKER